MKLKAKLVSTIAAFCLVLCLTIVGVWAVTSATVTMGGNISFTATDVNAKVSGVFANAKSAPTLTELVFDGSETAEDASDVDGIGTWSGWNMTFSGKQPVTLTITVTNTNAERALNATLENNSTSLTNCAITITADSEAYTSGTAESVAANNGKVVFVITIAITNPNLAASAALNFDLVLANAG